MALEHLSFLFFEELDLCQEGLAISWKINWTYMGYSKESIMSMINAFYVESELTKMTFHSSKIAEIIWTMFWTLNLSKSNW